MPMATAVTPRARSRAAPAAGWSSVRGVTLSSRIVEQIRTALFAGQIKPGEALGSEAQLAARFGVSRMAMRDALRSLEAGGVVDIRVGAKGGVFIAQGNPDRFANALAIQFKLVGITVEEMFDAQIAIEVMATELAATRADASDLAKLRDLLDQLRALAQKPMTSADTSRFSHMSMRFHETLVDASHNRALVAQFKALSFVLEPVYARRTTDTIAKRVIASHKAVLEAITAHDAERACTLMRRRLQTIRAKQLIKTT
jgi:GntR family transcriptional regulator, transcriptional repressor for pyruvate dehydrogenase complex